jgi:hypothetical protein
VCSSDLNGIAILATNGWWSYDFDPSLDLEQSVTWLQHKDKISQMAAIGINATAYRDAGYMSNSVAKLQAYQDVKSIIIVTHTVPTPEIIKHWSDVENIDSSTLRNVLQTIRLKAKYSPPNNHPLKNWWEKAST